MHKRAAAILGAIVIVTGTSSVGSASRQQSDASAVPPVVASVKSSSTTVPAPRRVAPAAPVSPRAVEVARPTAWGSELPPGAVALPATRTVPVSVRIAALDVESPVIPAGVTGTGELDLPTDAVSIAWFRDGAAPGESGSSVLAGHVDYNGERGALFDLADLPVGADIEVRFDDGTVRRFVTLSPAVSYRKASLPVDELFRRGGPPVLTLVTCGGHFDARTRSYADNVTVVAIPG